MAKRNRYKEIDQMMTRILIVDTAVFILFLFFAGMGLVALKVTAAIIALVASALCLVYLYMIGEFKKRRSRWLVLAFGSIVLCTLVSLILNYPSPAPVPPVV